MDFMKFKEMLIQFRERRGLNKSETALRLDVTPTYYMELETGRKSAPTREKLDKLSEIFELSTSEKQLFIDTAMEERLSSDAFEWLAGKEKIQQIPIISWVAANKWSESVDVFPVGQSDEHVSYIGKCKNCFALKVKGECMTPVFMEGDIIIVRPYLDEQNSATPAPLHIVETFRTMLFVVVEISKTNLLRWSWMVLDGQALLHIFCTFHVKH